LSRIFGVNPEEELNSFSSYIRFIHPEDLPVFAKLVANFPKNPKPTAVEIRALTKTGEVRWLRDVIHPEWDEKEQRVVRLVHAVQDITDRKRAEEELRRSEERYRLLVRNAPLGIISLNREKQIVDVNPTILKIFGFPSEETLRAVDLFAYPPFVEAGIASDLCQSLDRAESAVQERLYRTPWNQEVYLRYHLTPIRDPGGKMIGLQAVFEDFTESKRLENQLLQAQKMEAIGTLAGGIAHDFNNILSGIIGYGELIGYDLPEGSRTEGNLQELMKASQRAKDLVKQILAFSRRSEQEKKAISIEPLLKESLQLLRATLPTTIQIRLGSDGESGTIRANPTQIQQVIMNLGTNAAQALPENGGVIDIQLRKVEVNGGWAPSIPDIHPGSYVCLTVSDTGQGMAP
jgi:two-component system, cell cycle sensor histidine kinase and response regulator CckA